MSKGLKLPLLYLLLSALLLRRNLALPQPNTAADEGSPDATATTSTSTAATIDSSEEQSLDEVPSQRLNLLIFTLDEFLVLSNFTVQQSLDIFRSVLKDVAALKEPSDALHAKLKNFTDYIERAERAQKSAGDDNMTEMYNLVVQFSEIVEGTNTTVPENNSTENLYLEMSLKKNGLDKLEVDFLHKFLDFSARFNSQMDKYLELLSAEERTNDAKLIDWYKNLKDMKDGEAKLQYFAKFFENF